MPVTMRTYSIPVEDAITREHAISIACERFNMLYSDGEVLDAKEVSTLKPTGEHGLATGPGDWVVSFTVTGDYIGPAVGPDELDEDDMAVVDAALEAVQPFIDTIRAEEDRLIEQINSRE